MAFSVNILEMEEALTSMAWEPHDLFSHQGGHCGHLSQNNF